MEEDLVETCLTSAKVLHYLSKYTESNTLILLSRLLRVSNLHSLDEFQAFVEAVERGKE